jgi:uncharacterized membrane protein YebE (DUF533 family)
MAIETHNRSLGTQNHTILWTLLTLIALAVLAYAAYAAYERTQQEIIPENQAGISRQGPATSALKN